MSATLSRIHSKTALLALALLLPASLAAASPSHADNLRVLRINPSGVDVPQERQIVFQFNRPVVPVGRMDRTAAEIPVSISPDPGCEWRWLNTSSLACQLGNDNALVDSTRYRIVVRPGLETEDGERMEVEHRHEFVTRRPAIRHQWFDRWRSPGTPRVRVTFNQAVRTESVEEHLFFEVQGRRWQAAAEPFRNRSSAFIVSPVGELPIDSRVSLSVEPGVLSEAGSEPSVEDREIVVFNTFPEHRFLGVHCRDLEYQPLFLDVSDPHTGFDEAGRCDPLGEVRLVFSSPVIKEVLREHLELTPDPAGGREDYDPWENAGSYSRLSWAPTDHRYANWLPGDRPAATEFHLRADASALRDEFDRPLAEGIDFRFWTDHRRPRLVLDNPVSTLETSVDSHLPIVVTNLDRVRSDVGLLDAGGLGRRDLAEVVTELPEVEDLAFRQPLRVRDWLEKESGAVVGWLRSDPATNRQWFFSQVTPFGVHVKTGYYNSLVWVTDLVTGEPVAGARVELLKRVFETMASSGGALAATTTDEAGLALLPGAEELDPDRVMSDRWISRESPHLVVRVTRGEDHAILPLARDFFVRTRGPNEAYVPTRYADKDSHMTAWGLTPQGIYRAGDKIDYKIYVRREGNRRLEAAPRGSYELEVEDPHGKIIHARSDVELSDFGAFDGSFVVPKTGAVGWHDFRLKTDFTDQEWTPLRVLVSDFTPAPFRVSTELDVGLYRDGESVSVASQASLHSGGPYLDAASRITATVQAVPFVPADPALQGFFFDVRSYGSTLTVHRSESQTDSSGEIGARFDLSAPSVLYGSLTVETAVRDDRGKYVARAATARYASRDRFVGIRQGQWVLRAGEEATLLAVVADETGEAAPGTPISISIDHLKTTAARVKGAGNAYLTQYTHAWEKESSCELESAESAVECTFTPRHAGSYRLTATVRDTQDRVTSAEIRRWSVGKGRVLWEEPPGHHLQIEPEKETLQVGETARYLVKNPFPGAKALVTVERFGVIDRWVEVLEESSEILEFEVRPDYLPGYYLSVVVMSPRVAPPPDDGTVDLGKPTYRMGYVRVPVRDPYKELLVTATPSGTEFKPRETVEVEIAAKDRRGGVPEMEFAVAVLDEAVFDLLKGGTRLFDPYEGLYALRPLDLLNHNLLEALIGWQKFEQKGADPGGGGGSDDALRSLFKFVSYWNPSIRADSSGSASIEFEVPDNLTGWRVLVLAATPEDLLGLGEASFKVNLPTEIRPALPNQVIEGDRFDARFTVMNRTDRTRTLKVRGTASGEVVGSPRLKTKIRAEPFRRYTVSFPVAAEDPGAIGFRIEAGDRSDSDALATTLPVGRYQALEAAATYGTTTDARVEERLEFPLGIRTDVGRVSVVASPSVIGSLEGAFEYIRGYPYRCWEQRLTKGTMAAHYLELRRYLGEGFSWGGAQELVLQTLQDAADFQAPNGGMAYWVPQDDYVSPYLSAYTALAFGWLRELGYEVPQGVESRLHDYLGRLLREDAFPTFFSKGMASSVRSVALAALARADKVSQSDLARYRSHVPRMDLFGKAHFLQALKLVAGNEEAQAEVEDAILAHANETGGKIVFSENLDDGYGRMLHSELRSNCSVLSALALRPEEREAAGTAGLPFKLVRTITQTRGRRNHWPNTQENMFCTRALIEYSREFEAVAPDMTVKVSVGDERLGESGFDDLRDEAVEFERPVGRKDPGSKTAVGIDREGEGRLYYAVRLFYSPSTLERRRINSGIEARREYSVERDGRRVKLTDPVDVAQGELVRVDLFLSLPAPRNFVVVDDPVPGGLEPVNRDLATASEIDAGKAENIYPQDSYYFAYDDWRRYAYTRWSFYHRELRHDSARFYSDYLPAGNYILSYTAQVIAPGEFAILPLHVEEMYDPDVFGRGSPATLRSDPLE